MASLLRSIQAELSWVSKTKSLSWETGAKFSNHVQAKCGSTLRTRFGPECSAGESTASTGANKAAWIYALSFAT